MKEVISRICNLKVNDMFKLSDFEPWMIVIKFDDTKIHFKRKDSIGKRETRGKNSQQIVILCSQEEATH